MSAFQYLFILLNSVVSYGNRQVPSLGYDKPGPYLVEQWGKMF